MQCPACATELPEDDVFCESCGARLGPAAVQAVGSSSGCACGAAAGETDEDGFCLRCGLRVRRSLEADHIEQSISHDFAGVSDRGLRHERNEDRFGLFEGAGGCAIVVCDGVSTSQQSELASEAVAQGTIEAMKHSLLKVEADSSLDPEDAMRSAIVAGAAKLVAQSAQADQDNPPSTTVVAALVLHGEMGELGELIVGWLGDSRAYWIDGTGARLLTRDHSWVNEAISEGMTLEEAARSPRAHAITRWIGADSTGDTEPEIRRWPLARPGMLLLCTDGLWNYASTDAAMTKLVQECAAASEAALEIARALVKFANDRGGQDNITVAVLRFP